MFLMLFRTKVAWRLLFIERTLLCKRADWYCKPIFHIEALEKELVMARSHSFFSPAETARGTTLAELSLAMLLISILVGLSFPNIRHLNTLAQSTLLFNDLARLSKAPKYRRFQAEKSSRCAALKTADVAKENAARGC